MLHLRCQSMSSDIDFRFILSVSPVPPPQPEIRFVARIRSNLTLPRRAPEEDVFVLVSECRVWGHADPSCRRWPAIAEARRIEKFCVRNVGPWRRRAGHSRAHDEGRSERRAKGRREGPSEPLHHLRRDFARMRSQLRNRSELGGETNDSHKEHSLQPWES